LGKSPILAKIAFFASFFALGVIGLGAFTRLIDAGLGCPDWPGCYGHLTVPLSDQVNDVASYGQKLVSYKAWAEMIHRYFVGGLSLFILTILIVIPARKDTRTKANFILGFILLLLLIYQILLGQWTVTLKLLPVIVTQHLLGGFLILSTLWLIYLVNAVSPKISEKKDFSWLFVGALLMFVLTLIQITLGAWTSTNYASLSCTDFPLCVNDQSLIWHFKDAFNVFSPVGVNYEGGVLPESIRQTIQMTHRLGALILTTYIFIYMMFGFSKLKKFPVLMKPLYLILGLLSIQICLGISNVIFQLPLVTAMAHNLIAVLILLSIITLIYRLSSNSSKVSS